MFRNVLKKLKASKYNFNKNLQELSETLKQVFQRFSVGTSMHGYQELYTAKSNFWRVFWAIIVATSLGLTTFHVYTAVKLFMDQPTTTVLAPAKDDDVMYPPLRLCYALWMHWIDWKKVESLKYNKETILYGMNFYNAIFTELDFDEVEAKKNFTQLMNEYNFTTVFDFLRFVARKVPITSDDSFVDYFKVFEIIFIYPGYLVCYQVSSPDMYKYFHFSGKMGGKSRSVEFAILDENHQNFQNFLSPVEYNTYLKRWVNLKSKYMLTSKLPSNGLTGFSPTVFLFLNAFSDKSVDVMSENYGYDIELGASSFKWKNKEGKICLEGQQSVAYNNSCELKCQALATQNSDACRCLNMATLLNDAYKSETLCQRGIKFINTSTGATVREAVTEPYRLVNKHCSFAPMNSTIYEDCTSQCANTCQIWSYSSTVSVRQMYTAVRTYGVKNSTNIYITYPEGTHIITMTEVVSQTWDEFLGNVGGLLGIWTGASILSFIQVFYICCFADTSCGDCFGLLTRRSSVEDIKISSNRKVRVVNIVREDKNI